MKKSIYLLIILAIFISLFTFFKKKHKEKTPFKIGATVPNIYLLNHLKPEFKKAGLNIEIIEFSDYDSPNLALARNRINANFCQHKAFLEEFNKNNSINLLALSSIAIIPLGIYSNKYHNIKNLKNQAIIGIPKDPSNLTRALLVLEHTNLIKLNHIKNDNKDNNLTINDIIYNPKNLKFQLEDTSTLPNLINKLDAVLINGNYAFINNLNPIKDSIYHESTNSPYGNIVAIRKKDKDNKNIKTLMKIMTSKESKDYLLKHSDMGITPTF